MRRGVTSSPDTVLVAAERRRLVTDFEAALRPEYDVWTATSGRQALDVADNGVDVIAVGEETTDMRGAEVVSAAYARGLDYKAVSVGWKGDGRFDGRIPTPVTGASIVDTVDGLTAEEETGYGERRIFRNFGFNGNNPVVKDYEEWETKRMDGLGGPTG